MPYYLATVYPVLANRTPETRPHVIRDGEVNAFSKSPVQPNQPPFMIKPGERVFNA